MRQIHVINLHLPLRGKLALVLLENLAAECGVFVVGENGVEGLVRGEIHEFGMGESAEICWEVLALAGPGVEDGLGAWVFLG